MWPSLVDYGVLRQNYLYSVTIQIQKSCHGRLRENFFNHFRTKKAATNQRLKWTKMSKIKTTSVTEASQQDKPRKQRRAGAELSTLDTAHKTRRI